MTELTIAMKLFLESRGLGQGLQVGGRQVDNFGRNAKRQFDSVKRSIDGVTGNLAKMGLGIGAAASLVQSARLDQSINRIGLSASASRKEVTGLRQDIFRMARDTGEDIEQLKDGSADLLASGLAWRSMLPTIDAIDDAMAVTGSGARVLAGGLTVAASAFKFDLSQPGQAVELLDQMTVAGRLGNAELEDLAGIFSSVGVNAKSANASFTETLGLIEQLSLIEKSPDRLATLANSTLRLFTTENYKKAAQKATGVSFWNADKSARNPLDVLDDMATRYRALESDQARARFIDGAFGKADLDTIKGLRTLLDGNALADVRSKAREIERASGTIARDLPTALDNAVSQGNRLKSVLRDASETFTKPINKTIADLISTSLDPKSKGGLGMSKGEVVGYGIGTLLAGGAVAELARSTLGKLGPLGRVAGGAATTAAGVAQGKVLQEMAGVTPVFVTNWPVGGSGGGSAGAAAAAAAGGGILGAGGAGAGGMALARLMGYAKVAGWTAGAGVALYGGYQAGDALYDRFGDTDPFINGADKFGRSVDRLLSFFGNDEAQSRLTAHAKETARLEGTIKLILDERGVRLAQVPGINQPNVDIDVYSGPMRLPN
ncbi:phage tail tape measure protein [Solimonas sp. SE-A11]|uniref:phage tail tape measure protein n=1 Tax=Solimonas sp. SE-A11 TaxID=3054954 RepID=UPI00259C9126|nr:phage tail tape measure protein [Solimonas sp. SE-A11]MDM4768670.1 phage tail tape measure protein [Solimonas sp. SE-A11]